MLRVAFKNKQDPEAVKLLAKALRRKWEAREKIEAEKKLFQLPTSKKLCAK
jgi:hypothetical protein